MGLASWFLNKRNHDQDVCHIRLIFTSLLVTNVSHAISISYVEQTRTWHVLQNKVTFEDTPGPRFLEVTLNLAYTSYTTSYQADKIEWLLSHLTQGTDSNTVECTPVKSHSGIHDHRPTPAPLGYSRKTKWIIFAGTFVALVLFIISELY